MIKYPEIKMLINECVISKTIGYKPNLPENIYWGDLAQNSRKIYDVLKGNKINIYNDCEKYCNKK